MNLFDQINSLSADALASLRAVITVVAIAVLLMYVGKRQWQLSAFIVGGLLAGLLIFFVWGGLDVIRGWLSATIV